MASVMQAQTMLNPIADILAGFTKRKQTVDTVFFKLTIPERHEAILVSFAVHHHHRQHVLEIQATYHSANQYLSTMTNFPLSSIERDENGTITAGNCSIGPNGTRGHVGQSGTSKSISWDFVFGAVGPLVDPQVAGPIKPFDIRFMSVPDVNFSGNIAINKRFISFSHEPGFIGAYFGRRLPDHLCWISSNTFDPQGTSLECVMVRSRIFNIPFLRASIGYFYLRTPTSDMTILHPLTGSIRLEGNAFNRTIKAKSRQYGQFNVQCFGSPDHFYAIDNHFSINLFGSCEIAGVGIARDFVAITERNMTT